MVSVQLSLELECELIREVHIYLRNKESSDFRSGVKIELDLYVGNSLALGDDFVYQFFIFFILSRYHIIA